MFDQYISKGLRSEQHRIWEARRLQKCLIIEILRRVGAQSKSRLRSRSTRLGAPSKKRRMLMNDWRDSWRIPQRSQPQELQWLLATESRWALLELLDLVALSVEVASGLS